MSDRASSGNKLVRRKLKKRTKVYRLEILCERQHPVLKREDRLGKEPFAGFGTVVEDITGSGYTKNQPILLGAF